MLLGNDLSDGFSEEVIEQILAVCDGVNSVGDIHVRVDMWDFAFIVIWLVLHHSLFPPGALSDYEWMEIAFAKCFKSTTEDLKENGISAEGFFFSVTETAVKFINILKGS